MPQFSVKMGEIEWAMWANEQAVAGAFSKSQISHDPFNECLQESSEKWSRLLTWQIRELLSDEREMIFL